MADPGEVTQLLAEYRDGRRDALDRLLPLIYDDMRRIARSHLRRSGPPQTLNTTGLAHEAYLRLVDQARAHWTDRNHFLAVCAVAMRQIVIDNARKRAAAKRGGDEPKVTLNEAVVSGDQDAEWLLSLDQALTRLAAHDERLVRVVECRFFAGLTEEETGEALDVSLRTVQRDWKRARAWLREELGGTAPRSRDAGT